MVVEAFKMEKIELFAAFIHERSVPECEELYKRGLMPDTNPALFVVLPKSAYEEYKRAARANSVKNRFWGD